MVGWVISRRLKSQKRAKFFLSHIESRIQESIKQWYPEIKDTVDLVLAPMVARKNLAYASVVDDTSRLDHHVDYEVFHSKRSLMNDFAKKVKNLQILTESDPLVPGATIHPLQEDPNTPQD